MARNDDLNLGRGKPADAVPAAGRGKGRLLGIIAVLVILLGGAGGAWFWLAGGDDADADGATASRMEKRDPIYLPLEKFLVNFDHRGSIRYIQTDIQLMAYDQKALDNAQRNMPAVRNRLIMLLSQQEFDALRSVEGKEALRQEVLVAVNETLRATGPATVQDVYFTSFVLQ